MLEWLARWVGRYPKSVIAAIALLTGVLYVGMGRIEVASDDRNMLPEKNPKVVAFDEVDETFGGAEFVLVMLRMGDVFTTTSLCEIDELTRGLERLKGVSSVLSITNIEEIRGVEGGVEVVELVDEIPEDQAGLRELRDRVLSDDDYAGQIVSENGDIALVLVQLLPRADGERVVDAVEDTLRELGLEERALLTGETVMEREIRTMVARDMGRLLPLALLVIVGVLYGTFRSIRGVALPLLIVVVTVIWTFGLMGHTGVPMSAISAMMPIVLISMGVADGIHILARYREELGLGSEKRRSLNRAVVAVGLACFLTSVTTMIGFGSLMTSPLRLIREFGLFTGIGVGIAFIVTVTLLLAFLSILPPERRAVGNGRSALAGGVLRRWGRLVVRRPMAVIAVAGAVAAVALAGVPLLSTESETLDLFRPESSIRIAHDTMSDSFGGVEAIQVVVKGDIQDPTLLRAMESLQDDIEGIDVLGRPTSVVNVLRRTNSALHEGNPEYDVLPESEAEVAQYLLLLSLGGSDELDSMLSFEYDQALIQARSTATSTSTRDTMIQAVEEAIGRHFSDGDDVVVTGLPVLDLVMVTLVTSGQLRSLGIAIVLIFLLMTIISRSFVYGAFCSIPVSLTVLLNFGIMGWLKVPLDVASAMIASVAIGIGIDYAIHFFNRYKEELAAGRSPSDAVQSTMETTGQAIFYNAAAVGLGFLVLTFASMPPLGRVGWLTALTMLFSSSASMIVLPALLLLRDTRRGRRR